jgi:signal transduction histidine kinase
MLVAAVVIGVTTAILLQLGGIRRSSNEIVDEVREEQVCAEAQLSFVQLAVLLNGPMADADHVEENRPAVLELLTTVRSRLGEFHAGSPLAGHGAPGHESIEAERVNSIQMGLLKLQPIVATASAAELAPHASVVLDEIGAGFRGLNAEVHAEIVRSRVDLDRRLERSSLVMATASLAALVLLLAAWWLVRGQIVRPLLTIERGVERLGAGDLAARLAPQPSQELDAVTQALNQMAERLAASQGQLATLLEQRTRQFTQAAKLADMGRFAAGVAHEINTPLASVVASAEGVTRRLQRGNAGAEDTLEALQVIGKEARRTADLASQLLSLSRLSPETPQEIDFAELLARVARVLAHRLEKSGVRLQTTLPEGPLPIRQLPASELEQVLLNLTSNAIDACAGGGLVRISIELPVDGTRVVVEDDGCGIAPEHRERIFEPFFTTKGAGHGTGLGLPLVALIVEGWGGQIVVQPREPRGTRFELVLPLIDDVAKEP